MNLKFFQFAEHEKTSQSGQRTQVFKRTTLPWKINQIQEWPLSPQHTKPPHPQNIVPQASQII